MLCYKMYHVNCFFIPLMIMKNETRRCRSNVGFHADRFPPHLKGFKIALDEKPSREIMNIETLSKERRKSDCQYQRLLYIPSALPGGSALASGWVP